MQLFTHVYNLSTCFNFAALLLNVPLVATGLDATACLQSPVAVLHGTDIPPLRRCIKLQLEGFMVRYLILIGCYINT